MLGDRPVARVRQARRVAAARATVLAAVVVIADRVTKHLVVTGIPVGATRNLILGASLVHYRNSGVAFSFFAGGGTFVLALTLVALGALLAYFVGHGAVPGLWIATGLLLGGAIGNLIDRISSGAVTDFVKLPHWPAFNVADMGITFGVIALLYVLEGPRRRRGPDGG
jgi:signal peptidase II